MPSFHPLRRMGLRVRLTLSFALGAALVSVALSVITWSLTRENLLRQREDSATSRVLANAVTVRRGLSSTAPQKEELIGSLPTPDGAQPLMLDDGEWTARNPGVFNQDSLPGSVRSAVAAGAAVRMRAEVGGVPYLIVGVPIPAVGAEYYEGVSLASTQDTLDSLTVSLLGAAAITILGGGLIGFWGSRRVLVPVASVGRAAEAIAGGRLDTRLRVGSDPDLDPILASFNDMAAALQARIERDARFASEVSHELRSPLMTLSASVEVLDNNRDDLTARAQSALDLLKADLERFSKLVTDLLEISRYDVGAVSLHAQPVLVTEMVIQAVAASGKGRIPVVFDDDVNETGVMVDKTRIFRVIDNLLDNAAKYAGGATGVQLALAPPGDDAAGERVRIAIEDQGHGVPESERNAIFHRFSRGTEGGNRGSDSGVGLGLALVDEHVRLHGGRVWVEDRLDGAAGARFVVELPVLGDEEPAEDLSAPAPATDEELAALGVTEPAEAPDTAMGRNEAGGPA